MTTVVQKQPAEERILAFAFADALVTGATLATIASVTPTSQGLVSGSALIALGTAVINGTDVRVLVSGGTDKEAYQITCLVVDSEGQTLDADAILLVLAAPASAALIVEDGTGMATAESYVSVAWADDYLRRRARAATWDTYDVTTKAAYLLAATEYLDAMCQWRGTVLTVGQALGWPRSGALDKWGRIVDGASVPGLVKTAVVEIAALGGITQEGGQTVREETIGPITTVYETGMDRSVGRSRYKLAFDLVAALALNPAGSLALVRS